jgi:hypothetical protein
VSNTSVEITAGLGGFLVLFGLALVVWFLGRDLSRRLRRMRQQEALRQAQVTRDTQGPADAPGTVTPPRG